MSGRLYFAYGSNLSLTQMARRCPASYFHGRAVLHDYQWQINQRGVANIVPRAGHCVHGLVYELGADDEERLDRNEGVRAGYYSKVVLPVVLYRASEALQTRTKRFADIGGAEAMVREVGKVVGREKAGSLEPEVLVYVSEMYARRGEPREEYVDRMNRAMEDGIAMGIPAAFFHNAVREYIPSRPALSARRVYPSRHRPRRRSQPKVGERSRSAVAEVRERGRDGDNSGDERDYSESDGCDGYRTATQGRSGRGRRREEEEEYEYQRRPLSWTARDYDYTTSYHAGKPRIRTVTPGVGWYPARGRWSSAL
ncbi:AIG2 family protein [Diplogelasinospora grovesii]|uniref:gamma-glutamylcyclotransferase n=1 Tax=Diplogelasinospora grovesii TaxID=303347 RepID=A0AAN6MYT1_9PEZI|nr:AIG2 family protein [Diplogelasinospora grovesii]